MINFVKSLRERLLNKLRYIVCKYSCQVGVHSAPRWLESGYYEANPGLFATYRTGYYGICRNCTTTITPNYAFGDTKGPLYKGLKEYAPGRRSLEDIVRACVIMFLKDSPTNGY